MCIRDRRGEFVDDAEYFSEEVRRQVKNKFGEDALYEGGLLIRTCLLYTSTVVYGSKSTL